MIYCIACYVCMSIRWYNTKLTYVCGNIVEHVYMNPGTFYAFVYFLQTTKRWNIKLFKNLFKTKLLLMMQEMFYVH